MEGVDQFGFTLDELGRTRGGPSRIRPTRCTRRWTYVGSKNAKMAIAPRAEHSDWELYQLLVDSVVDYAIFALDTAGNVATWNKGAQRLKGYTAEEIVGRNFSVFYPEEDVRADNPRRELE